MQRDASSPAHIWYEILASVPPLTGAGGDFVTAASRLEASTSSPPVKLQVLLRKAWRNADGIEKVRKLLTEIGLKPTASGAATISAEAQPEHFETVFGVRPDSKPPRPPSGTDFGQSGGSVSSDLAVPDALAPYVESISAAPPHVYLQN